MNEFIKIFLGISALATAFFLGRNYGENIYNESVEHKSIIKAASELTFTKNEFENTKIKLQNIIDQAESKKTEEFLEQILHILTLDFGIKIPNKEAILKIATRKNNPEIVNTIEKLTTEYSPLTEPLVDKKNENDLIKKKSLKDIWNITKVSKFKSYEWMVKNSNNNNDTIRALKRVQIKNINSILDIAENTDIKDCESLLGLYKGEIKNINNDNFGKLEFKLSNATNDLKNMDANVLHGKTSWLKNKKIITEQINNSCGKKISGLGATVLSLSTDKYIQVYKLNSAKKIAGNFYEVLPNGTSKIIGSFVLE